MKAILPIAMLCCALAAGAQSPADVQADSLMADHRIISLGSGGVQVSKPVSPELRERFVNFYYDQFRHAQDPEAPYFMFMSKDSGLMMGIGGVVRMRAWYDWAGSVPANGFSPILIPMQPDPAQRRHLGTTPAGTCLYFRLAGRSGLLGDYSAYIEANFNGWQGRDFHLKKAYVTVRDVTVGYAASTFSDPAAVPSTVDAAGPSNKLARTSVLVRYMPRVARHVMVGASVEAPEQQIDADGTDTKECSVYVPDFAALVQYDWGRGQHVRLSGIVRTMAYRDLRSGRNRSVLGWGVQLSSVSNPWAPLTLYATVNYGAGYAGLGGDLLAGAYDLIADPDRPGRLYAPRSLGWCVGVQYNFLPNLFATLIGSQTRFLPGKAISPAEYKYGLLGSLNIFWNPVPRVQLGAEIDLAKRQDFSRDHRYARRVGIMGQLSF
ncbi:MAG: hypothetical protein NC406_06200 [Bacteroides sp.]|nr:hypothetical protein [Bacteroides sp.]MCM1096053.1 hypothetical protein [Terasakiella sp.]